jgi:hypothetical protein
VTVGPALIQVLTPVPIPVLTPALTLVPTPAPIQVLTPVLILDPILALAAAKML